ncbi:MAG: outer membrane protein transport protein, partial [Pseudomonadota bacterium]
MGVADRGWRGLARTSAGVAIAAISGGAANAAGFGVYEFNAEAIGSAYATATATRASDYMFYNPAAIGGLDKVEACATFTAILPNSGTRVDPSTTVFATPIGGEQVVGGAVSEAFVPALSFAAPITDDFAVGLAVHAPWGLQTEYPRDWAGRYYAVHTELMTLNINPVAAYNVTDDVTVAVGLQAQYAEGRLSNAVDFGSIGAFFSVPGAVPATQDGFADFEASDWSFGFTAGLMADLAEGL